MHVTVIQPNETKSVNYFDMELQFNGLKCADLSLQVLVYDKTQPNDAFFGEHEKLCNQTATYAKYFLNQTQQNATYQSLMNDKLNYLVI